MPATQAGQYDKRNGKWAVRWYDRDGKRRFKGGFASKSAAREHFRTVIEPQLNGVAPAKPNITLREFVPIFLERHQGRDRTVDTLRDRLGLPKQRDGESEEDRRKRETNAVKAFGNVPLREFERMVDEVAGWAATLPERSRYGRVSALRQCLGAAQRWGYISQNPAVLAGKNPQPGPRDVRVYSMAELDAIAAELSPQYQSVPQFAAATGLRPEEWAVLERRDIDRRNGVLNVRRTLSSGEVVELGKTSRSRRQVPLSPRALAALDALPPRLDTPLLWTAPEGGLLHFDNFGHREWRPAIKSAAIPAPARVYDMRHTFASNAIAARIDLFELARIMGTSVEMLERVYGSLLGGAVQSMADRLGAWEAATERAEEAM